MTNCQSTKHWTRDCDESNTIDDIVLLAYIRITNEYCTSM